MIKAFEFVNFFEQDWDNWKQVSLLESATGGEVSKVPINYDENDWKFLSQFPTEFWNRALLWRYSEGLIRASKERKKFDPNEKTYPDLDYEKQFTFVNKDGSEIIFPGQSSKGFYIGLTELLKKLENPVTSHIRNIDFRQTDTNHPEHFSQYKGGLHDYDFTGYQEETGMFAGASPMKEGVKIAEESLEAWYKAMGLGLLGKTDNEITDPNTGERYKVENLHGNQLDQIKLTTLSSPLAKSSRSKQYGLEMVGKDDNLSWDNNTKHSQVIPLTLPVFNKKIPYFEKNFGRTTGKTVDAKIPVLKQAKFLPVIELTPEQRRIIAIRRGYDPVDDSNIKGVRNPLNDPQEWAELFHSGVAYPHHKFKTVGAFIKYKSQLYGINDLLQNWDVLNDKQTEDLLTKQPSLHEVVRAIHDKNYIRQNPFANNYYKIGYFPNTSRMGLPGKKMSQEDYQKAFNHYKKQLEQEVFNALNRFILEKTPYNQLAGKREYIDVINSETIKVKDRTNTGYLSKELLNKLDIDMITKVFSDIIGLHLNNRDVGIRNVDLKLTEVPEDADVDKLRHKREEIAYNLIANLAKKLERDIGTYRETGTDYSSKSTKPVISDDSGTAAKMINPKSLGLGELLKTYQSDIESKLGTNALQQFDKEVQSLEKQTEKILEKPEVKPKSTKQQEARKFLEKLIDEESALLPVYDEEKDEFIEGQEIELQEFKDAKQIVEFITALWEQIIKGEPEFTKQLLAEFAVPLLIAAFEMHNVELSDDDAIKQMIALGVTPKQLPIKPSLPSLSKPPQVSPEIKSITGLLADLGKNYKELLSKNIIEFTQNKEAIKQALAILKAKMDKKEASSEERTAWILINSRIKSLAI